MKTGIWALAFIALCSGCDNTGLQQKLVALRSQYSGTGLIEELEFGRKADLVALVTVTTVDGQVRATDQSQGWACSAFSVEEILKGKASSEILDVVCAYAIYRPDLELGTLSDRRAKNPIVDAQKGDRLLIFLRVSDQLTRLTGRPVYYTRVIYRMKPEPNKAIEPTPVNVTAAVGF